jgi:hypothetical protein
VINKSPKFLLLGSGDVTGEFFIRGNVRETGTKNGPNHGSIRPGLGASGSSEFRDCRC